MTNREPTSNLSDNSNRKFIDLIAGLHSSITDAGEIRKARFLVVSSVILSTGVGALTSLLLVIAPEEILAYLPVLVSTVAANVVAYILGRTRLYKLGSWVLLTGIAATGFALIPLRPEDVVDQLSSTLPIAFIVGSLLFTIPEFIVFGIVNVAIILSIPTLMPQIETPLMMAQAVIYTLIGGIILTVTTMRNKTERGRLAEANQANEALRKVQSELEVRIAERTADLTAKTSQLRTSAAVAQRVATLRNTKELVDTVVSLIANEFNLYHVGIFLITEQNNFATFQASSSQGGQKLLEQGFKLRVGEQGIIGAVALDGKARVVSDANQSDEFLYDKNLPDTKSEMCLPLVVRNEVIGILDLQSSEERTFNQDDIEVFQSMADQISLALENARLLAESEAIIKQLQAIMSENVLAAWKSKAAKGKLGYTYTPLGIKSGITKNTDNKLRVNIPIQLRGQTLGYIKLQRDEHDAWSEREESLILELATQVGLAIENARLLEEAEQRAEREQLISEITSRTTQNLDIEIMLQQVIREFGLAVGSTNTFVQIGFDDPRVEGSGE